MPAQLSLPFRWRTTAPAVIDLYVPQPAQPSVAVHAGAWCVVELTAPDGVSAASGPAGSPLVTAARQGPAGVWNVTVRAVPGEGRFAPPAEAPLWIECEHGFPFVVPGPGIVPSHLATPEPILQIDASQRPLDVWFWVAPGLEQISLQASHFPRQGTSRLTAPDGSDVVLDWLPKTGSYRSLELRDLQSGWWRLPIASGAVGRLTSWEGVPLFAAHGPDLPASRLDVTVTGRDGTPLAARAELWRNQRRWAILDRRAGETATFCTLPGDVEARVSHGFAAVPSVTGLGLQPGRHSLQVRLEGALTTPPGWLSGDHHTHSFCEDGGQSPESVVRAAIAQGLDYVVVTDEPEPLLEHGLQRFNAPGAFLAMPGQECMNPDVHCNALNTYATIDAPAYGQVPETYPGPVEWQQEVERQSREHPALLMLNHPTHLPDTLHRQRYFHAWSQLNGPGLKLVENCDFGSWFARLNAGQRLVALWTTDAHDMAWIPTGSRRSYVYVGDERAGGAGATWQDADIIAALAAGRVFNTRHPGALLLFEIDGKMPGEVTPLGSVSVSVSCRSARPLRSLELIVNGRIHSAWPGHGAFEWKLTRTLNLPAGWALVRAYVHEEPAPQDGHSAEPFGATGCIAFTNPVYLN